MTLRRTLTGLALCVMALTLFMGCAESGPPPSYPPMVEAPPPPSPPHYFVTVSGLALREGPTTAATQVGTLEFNDEVMVLEPPRVGPGWMTCAAIGLAGPPCATCSPCRLTSRSPCPGDARRRLPQGATQARRISQGHVGAVLPGNCGENRHPIRPRPGGDPRGRPPPEDGKEPADGPTDRGVMDYVPALVLTGIGIKSKHHS